MADCLTGLVGIWSRECQCVDNIIVGQSSTGIFLDTQKGMKGFLYKLANNPECGQDINDTLEANLSDACRCVLTDIGKAVSKGKETEDYIGRDYITGLETSVGSCKVDGWAINKIIIPSGQDISFCINGIGLLPIKQGSNYLEDKFTVTICDSNGEVIKEVCVQTKKNGTGWETFDEPLRLKGNPNSCTVYYAKYYVGGKYVSYNYNRCTCGEGERWPDYMRHSRGYFVGGITTNKLQTYEDFLRLKDNYNCGCKARALNYGMQLNISINCDITESICDLVRKNPITKNMVAKAIAAKVSECTLFDIVCNPSHMDTLAVQSELIADLRGYYANEYDTIIEEIAGLTELKQSGCFCDTRTTMRTV